MVKGNGNGRKIPFSPVYGYATEEQYKMLQGMKDGADYKQLKKIIAEQTKRKGLMDN